MLSTVSVSTLHLSAGQAMREVNTLRWPKLCDTQEFCNELRLRLPPRQKYRVMKNICE